MARRRNDFLRAIDDLEAFFIAPLGLATQRAAQEIVKDLQVKGPIWTGRFSNSWEIASPSRTVRGSGQPGLPVPLTAPVLSVKEVKFKPEVKYTISNFATGDEGRYSDQAMDLAPGIYKNPGSEPLKKADRGVRQSGIRGDLAGSTGPNRRTAPENWYSAYINSGNIEKAIKLYMDKTLRSRPR